ncbi:MAG: Trm112 family protein [Terracidiphilus sp.]
MTDDPAHPSIFDRDTLDPDLLAQLACPACYGELRLESARLRCLACSRGYPIVDGIPVMTVERAERLVKEP